MRYSTLLGHNEIKIEIALRYTRSDNDDRARGSGGPGEITNRDTNGERGKKKG
jgi:hypothetical protein